MWTGVYFQLQASMQIFNQGSGHVTPSKYMHTHIQYYILPVTSSPPIRTTFLFSYRVCYTNTFSFDNRNISIHIHLIASTIGSATETCVFNLIQSWGVSSK